MAIQIKKSGAAASAKNNLTSKKTNTSNASTVTIKKGTGKIANSTTRYDPDDKDRDSVGSKAIELYVDVVPVTCESCPFYIKNSNNDKIKANESVFYCMLRSLLATAQYGGINVMTPKTWLCPLKPVEQSAKFKQLRNNHLDRIKSLERAVFDHDNGDDGVY